MVEQLISEPPGSPVNLEKFRIVRLPETGRKGVPSLKSIPRAYVPESTEEPVGKPARSILKRKPLAIWTSLISAKVMTSYCEKNYRSVSRNDWEVLSFEDLAFLDPNHLREYELLLISVYDRDLFSKKAFNTLSRLALQKKFQSSTPISIFHCGQSHSTAARKWCGVINQLSKNCGIRVDYCKNEFPGTRISRLISPW